MLTNSVAPDSGGGLERYVAELSRELSKRGLDITIFCKHVRKQDPLIEILDSGVTICRYEVPEKSDRLFAGKYLPMVRRGVRQHLRAQEPFDIAHGHFAVPCLGTVARGAPFVYTFHAPVSKELASERQNSYVLPSVVEAAAVRGLRMVERRLVRDANEVVVLSDFMKAEVSALDSAAGSRARLVPGGVDVNYFAPGDAPRVDWLHDASHVIVVARRLVPRTGVAEFVSALPEVLKVFPLAKVAILGDGLQRPVVEREIRRNGLERQVRLFGFVPEDELCNWYRRADLVVTPTMQLEGFGLSTAEAMACGTPTLVTPIGANQELARLVSARLISNSASVDDLSRSMVDLLRDVDWLHSLSAPSRDAAVLNFGWERVADIHIDIYESLLVGERS